jgi:hypothetical protein
MAEAPIPSCEFGPSQKLAFALAGTVAIPSPFPAHGTVSIGIFPATGGADSAPRFFLKIVETASSRTIVTRLVALEDVRAVRLYSGKGSIGESQSWTYKTIEELSGLINDKTNLLMGVAKSGLAYEVELFAEPAIVFVPESAPVLLRYEIGVTAAVCAESAPATKREIPCPGGWNSWSVESAFVPPEDVTCRGENCGR